ncbi:MAG: HAMP domain-containing sensor histidine kinase [Gaiellales bacterium]
MFQRARRRLTLLYAGLFAGVLVLFSLAFYVLLSFALQPAFDIAPEITSRQAADAAYTATLQRIGLGLVGLDVIAIGVVAGLAWLLATRAMRPIREAHERQRRFVADASHEMRSPLAALRGAAETGLADPTDATLARRSFDAVVNASERLADLTADLLVLARDDQPMDGGEPEPFDLSVLVAETVEEVSAGRPGSPAVGLELAPDLVARGERSEIRRVVANLVDNALLYGSAPVRLQTAGTEREVSLTVRDGGPGIAAADREQIFTPFYRVRRDAASTPGTGLGLAIASSLTRRNGGRLGVESEPGAGATFVLSLPRFR